MGILIRNDVLFAMVGKVQEVVAHITAGRSSATD